MKERLENYINKAVELKEDAILYKNELFTYYDSGLTRKVFVNQDKTKVIKININNDFDYNLEEWQIYVSASEEVIKDFPITSFENGIIEQEYVEPIKFNDKQLTIKQTFFAKSCRNEVGWKGEKLLCFDLNEYKKY